MKTKKILVVLLVSIMACVVISCDMPTLEGNVVEDGIGDDIEENNHLFVKQANGSHIFTTNDTTYIKATGYTIWGRQKTETNFTDFEVELKKFSGNAKTGYGVIFNETGTINEADHSMLSILVNIEGEYAIGKIDNGVYTNIEWWKEGYSEGTKNNALKEGYRTENTIKVSYDTESDRYTLYINSLKIQDFIDTRKDKVKTGNRGYAVVISPNEGFPNKEVKVEFSKDGTI